MQIDVVPFTGGVTQQNTGVSLIDSNFTYPVPEQTPNYNFESFKSSESDTTIETDLQPNVVTDFSLLSRYIRGENVVDATLPYIICRLEGKDLVVRAKLTTESTLTELAATAVITILTKGTVGNTITFNINDPLLGFITLGSYTVQAGDTTLEIIATNITTALNLNSYGYVFESLGNKIRVTSRPDLSDTINGVLITNSFFSVPPTPPYVILQLTGVNLSFPISITAETPTSEEILTTVFNTGFAGNPTVQRQALIDLINSGTATHGFTAQTSGARDIKLTGPSQFGADMNGFNCYMLSSEKGAKLVTYVFANGIAGNLPIHTSITPFSGGVDVTKDAGGRVALMKDVFTADGLNHTLRLIFRPEGVEVYKDYSHLGVNTLQKIGICLWRHPSISEDSVYYEPFEIPKVLIETMPYKPYLSELFLSTSTNTGVDAPKAWDMFIGLPTNIDFYFKKITVFENYGIDSFDESDNMRSINNYTAEYWSFTISDNEGDVNNLKISCEFSQIEPNIAAADYSYVYPVEQFNNKIVVQDLKLYSKQLLSTPVQRKYFNRIQDFFTVEKIFEQNAYSKTIHKDYDYENFNGKIIKLYNLYSPQVLSYNSLTPFLDLIENKFKPIIKDFIPIVINISEFGRLIQNSLFIQPKVHYIDIHKKCVGKIIGNALIQIRIFEKILVNTTFSIELENGDGTSLIPPTPISWMGTMPLTEFEILSQLRSLAVNPNPDKIKVLVNDGVLAIVIDSEWYYNNYGQDPNDILFKVEYISLDTYPVEIKFKHGTLDFNTNTCGSIEHRLPIRETGDKFVYFESENQPDTFINFDSENSPNHTYLNFD
jgi:hypothetical protein